VRDVTSRDSAAAGRRGIAALTVCRGCSRFHEGRGEWIELESFLFDRFGARVSHGICSRCRRRLYPAVVARRQGQLPRPAPPSAVWQPVCAGCHRFRTSNGRWMSAATYTRRRGVRCRRGLCPTCAKAAAPASRAHASARAGKRGDRARRG